MAEWTGSVGNYDNAGLRLKRLARGQAVVVHAAGDVDMGNVSALHAELAAALAAVVPPAPVVVDLTGVEFLGSAGLNELLAQHNRADEQSTPLRIVATQRPVLRLIEVAGLNLVLAVYPDLERALRS